MMVLSTHKTKSIWITMLSLLNTVIMIMMVLLTCVKSTDVLLKSKMNTEPNPVQVTDLSIVNAHSMLNQNVKVNGIVPIFNKSLLISWLITILMLMELLMKLMKFMEVNILKSSMIIVIITVMDKLLLVKSSNVLLIVKMNGEKSTAQLEN